MKIFGIKRVSKRENRHHPNMGALSVLVIRIKKTFLGIPYKTIHKYRKTYHGKVKDCDDCDVSKV